MNTDYMRTFCVVVEEGSFSLAAQRLHLSQPAVSLQVKAIEQEFSGRLLDRSAKPVLLTPLGQEVYGHLRAALDELHRAHQRPDEPQRDPVRIGVNYSLGEYLMPPLVAEFQVRNPQVRVALNVYSHQVVVRKVLSQDVDGGIIGFIGREDYYRRLRALPLWEESFFLTVAASHPLTRQHILRLEDLNNMELIFHERETPTRRMMDNLYEGSGIQPRMGMEMGSNEAVKAAILSGLGIAFLSECCLEPELSEGRLTVVEVQGFRPKRLLRFVHLRNHPPSAALRLLLAFMKQNTGQRLWGNRATAVDVAPSSAGRH